MNLCPVILLADRSNSDVDATASTLESGLADVVAFIDVDGDDLSEAQLAIAIGGDGTLISHGPMLAMRDIPLVGVNCGNLGFLAKFDAESLIEQRGAIFPEPPPTLKAMMLEVRVDDGQATIAMNEAMIAAGHPFRILELGLSINNVPAPTLHGDGIIVSTPIGSTAHSASVGGPIMDPSADAFVLTPVAAHSLANRPIVLDAGAKVTVDILKANRGTSLVIDGKVHCQLKTGMQVHVKRSEYTLSIVLNPSSTYWNTLVDKLHWAAPPG
ncbi:MAG TPA: NAD(+)/NADH kinase [Phycisphaerales bacterium]|nr:NAD(+)/NADH kinase [Phycisphaerales bacterium]